MRLCIDVPVPSPRLLACLVDAQFEGVFRLSAAGGVELLRVPPGSARAEVIYGTNRIVGRLRLLRAARGIAAIMHYRLNSGVVDKFTDDGVRGRLSLTSGLDLSRPWRFEAAAEATLKGGAPLSLRVSVHDLWPSGDFRGSVSGEVGGRSAAFELVAWRHCPFAYRGSPSFGEPELSFDCPFEVVTKSGPMATLRRDIIGLTVRGGVSGERHPWLTSELTAQVQAAQFSVLCDLLAASGYAVPAPLNILEGSVSLKMRAEAHLPTRRLLVEGRLTTALSSKGGNQVVRGRVDSQFDIQDWKATRGPVVLAVTLDDVRLSLPRISLYGRQPQILFDRRLAPPQPARAQETPLTWTVRVRTARPNALQLASNLAQSPIPVSLDVQTGTGQKVQGYVAIAPVKLNFFKRDATVEGAQLTFGPLGTQIDGRLVLKYVDYTVRAAVIGPLEAPVIRFSSDPPVSEREISSILLFGRPMGDFDSDQLDSMANLRAAAADGALTLASLYLLAGTPIERVSYDPQSKAFLAKVVIAPGVSIALGSDFDQYRSVGVRRRIAPSWAISSEIERRSESEPRSATTMIEWTRRY